MRSFRWIVLWLLFAATPETLGARLEIPLRVPLEAVRIPGEMYREGPCRHLTLESPKVEAAGAHLKLTSPGTGAIGVELLGKCQSAGDWRGTVELTFAPLIDK